MTTRLVCTAESKAGMTHPEWVGYPDRVRASHWRELFPARDVPAMFTPSATQDAQFEALAKYIPAVSAAAGKVAALNRNNFDLNDDSVITRPNEWGRNHSQYGMSWLHSDMKDVSYFFNFKFYEKVIEKGGLR